MQYFLPATLKELLLVLDSESKSEIIAGGTDLIIIMEGSGERPEKLIDITNIEELIGIKEEEYGISIGAATTIAKIAANSSLPCCLRSGANSIGSPQIRNVGTVGGNICNASPCGDTLTPLICLNATLLLRSVNSQRLISVEQFFLGPKKTVLKKNEVLSEIRINKEYLSGASGFRMIGQRNGQVISQVNLAVWLQRSKESGLIEEIRIAAGSVAPTPVRIIEAEEMLCNTSPEPELIHRAALLVQASITPIDDVRSTAQYRQDVIIGLFGDIMTQLLKEPQSC